MKKSYYAIIPANVRYDDTLSANAKLLYGEITALCNEKGYCWAGNHYFAELYKVSDRSIRTWISQLVSGGYIKVKLVYRSGTKEVESRFISITAGTSDFPTFGRNLPDPTEENFQPPAEENFHYNNTGINNTVNSIATPRNERPNIDAIKNYFREIGIGCAEAESFFDHYESNGWKIGGRSPMKDWKAACRNWKRNQSKFNSNGTPKTRESVATNFIKRGQELFARGQENTGS